MKIYFICLLLVCPSLVYAKKCADFKTQQEAQAWFEKQQKSGGSGWKGLDRDGDGRACDCLPGGNGKNCPSKKKR